MIYVCPLSAIERAIALHKPSHMISLLDPGSMVDTPQAIARTNHLQVGINDISEPEDGLIFPQVDHVQEVIDFASAWPREAPILIHCWAGISRSTASAFITMCVHNEAGNERALAKRIRDAAPHAQPNRRIVALADDLLGRKGAMVDAVAEIGPGEITGMEGVLFGIPVPA